MTPLAQTIDCWYSDVTYALAPVCRAVLRQRRPLTDDEVTAVAIRATLDWPDNIVPSGGSYREAVEVAYDSILIYNGDHGADRFEETFFAEETGLRPRASFLDAAADLLEAVQSLSLRR